MNKVRNMMGRLLDNYNYLTVIGVLLLLVMLWVVIRSNRTSTDLSVFVNNVHPGMTATDLKAKLGPPLSPSDLPREIPIYHKGPDSIVESKSSSFLYWYDGSNLLKVYFDNKMQVTGCRVFTRAVSGNMKHAAIGSDMTDGIQLLDCLFGLKGRASSAQASGLGTRSGSVGTKINRAVRDPAAFPSPSGYTASQAIPSVADARSHPCLFLLLARDARLASSCHRVAPRKKLGARNAMRASTCPLLLQRPHITPIRLLQSGNSHFPKSLHHPL